MDLELTRGDTKFYRFKIKDKIGNSVQLSEKDRLYFTVKENQDSTKVIIQKTYPKDIKCSNGYFIFELSSDDTADLETKTYQYDIELKTDKYIKTLGFGTITLTGEITHRGDE